MPNLLSFVGRMDSRYRLLVATSTTLRTSLLLPGSFTGPTRVIIGRTVFALTLLVLIWFSFYTGHPRQLPQLARLQESSRTFLFVLVLGAAVCSLGTVVALLMKVKGLPPGELSHHLSVSIVVVAKFMVIIS